MTQTVEILGAAGLRNDIEPERFAPEDLSEALNIDLDKTGAKSSRLGSSLLRAGVSHSAWSDGQRAFFVADGTLYELLADMSTIVHATGMSADRRVAFTSTAGVVFWSDGVRTGSIAARARGWGLPLPAKPVVSVIPGDLRPGAYMVALAFVRDDGLQSGASHAALVRASIGDGVQTVVGVAPSLVLDFTTPGFDPRITYTRTGPKTYYDATGTLQTAADNEWPVEYDPATGACLGRSVWESSENKLIQSGRPDLWSRGAITSVVSQGVGELGLTWYRVTPNGVGNSYLAATIAFNAGDTVTRYGLFKKVVGDKVAFEFADGGTQYVLFNLTTQAISGTAALLSGASIAEIVPGVFKCQVTKTFTNAGNSQAWYFGAYGVGAATDTIDFAIGQVEKKAFPTPYIPTTAAAVTRGAETALIDGTDFSEWYNQSEGTFVAEYAKGHSAATGTDSLLCASDNTASNRIWVRQVSDTLLDYVITAGGVSQCDTTGFAFADQNWHRAAAAYKTASHSISQDGAAVQAGAGTTVPTVDRLYLGANFNGGESWNGYIRRIVYYPQRIADADLRTLSPLGSALVSPFDSAGESGRSVGLRVTLPTSSDADVTGVAVFVSPPDGEQLRFVGLASPGATFDYQTARTDGYSMAMQFAAPPPASQVLAYYRGRIYIGGDGLVAYTDALSYHHVNPRTNFLPVNGRVTMLAACEAGLFVGTDRETGFFAGSDPAEMTYVRRSVAGVLPGSLAMLPAHSVLDGSLADAGEIPFWMSSSGVCAGLPGGQVRELTARRYLPPDAVRAAGGFKQRGGIPQYVVNLFSQ